MLFRIVDIETATDYSCWGQGERKWRLSPACSLRGDEEQHTVSGSVRLVPEPVMPPVHAQRVVAVAWCDVSMDPASSPKTYAFTSCETHAAWTDGPTGPEALAAERELVTRFRTVMQEHPPATLVTWNGRTFDLPVLTMRALHLGVPWGWYYDDRDYRYRYSDKGHVDLMDFLSDYGASRYSKLDDVARLIGLPGKDVPGQDHVDGSMVGEIVAQGNIQANKDRIARYCLQDVLQTALVFVRTRYHLEIINALGYHESVVSFAAHSTVRGVLPVDWSRLALDPGVADPGVSS